MLALKLSFLLLVLASANVAIAWLLPGPCDSDPCKNGGKCTVVLLSYRCACADGWKGKRCTVKVKPCESSPCKNGATCTDKDDTFECACKDDYLGETCSERIQCENPLDLLFVVDASSWQIAGDFTHVTDFMSDLIDWLKISDLAVKAGVIAFSYKGDTRVIFLPDAYSDARQLKNAIGNLKKNGPKIFYGHEGYTAKALKLANDEVFKTADQHPNAAKAIVLLTPQVPLDSKSDAIKEAKKLRDKGVKIVSIDLVNVFKAFFKDQSVYKELTKISSPLKPIASAYDKLDDHVRELTNLLCSFTKDPCEDIDCGKRKICSYDRDTTSCICNKTNCEVQPCDETPCKNDGECENVDKETFKCNCTEAWTGKTCEEKVLPCESSPCKNSAECESVDENKFNCTCTEDWTGLTCEEKVHPCDKAESPCKNEATCERAEDQFVCKCAKGWKGETCEEKVQPCDKSPCKNQAQCENVDEENFKCQCSDGWKGDTCEEKVLPCERNPCKNSAVCENVDENTFNCTCTEDWTGRTCEEKVHACDKTESPCKNDGVCEKNGDEFVCNCSEYWTGPTCGEFTAFEGLQNCSKNSNRKRVGDRVIARWTNNKYYAGEITNISEEDQSIDILFDDGYKITHALHDVTAVLADKVPDSVEYKDHVITSWQGSYRQYIGYVIQVSESQGFKVRFDDNGEAWYKKDQLRILPDASSPHDVGARVFARWTNGLYYRGFVSKSVSLTVSINYDDGGKITLAKNDKAAVILDKIPQDNEVKIGQKVIGYWPGRVRYYPGQISKFCDDGSKYFLKFNDGDERCEAVYEIRAVPEGLQNGDRVIARWTNNKYYAGEITNISEEDQSIVILFDGGYKMTHALNDVTAVLADKVPDSVEYKDHVIASWQGSYRQYIGYVIQVSESRGFKVHFDGNGEAWYKKEQLRILPDASSPHDVGARVFARWTNGLYYRGFVSKSVSLTVSINYDDGGKITLAKNDKAAVILDKIPQDNKVKIGQKVIGYWPGRVRYYPGQISKFCDDGSKYFLKFNDGDERCEAVYEIRTVPEGTAV